MLDRIAGEAIDSYRISSTQPAGPATARRPVLGAVALLALGLMVSAAVLGARATAGNTQSERTALQQIAADRLASVRAAEDELRQLRGEVRALTDARLPEGAGSANDVSQPAAAAAAVGSAAVPVEGPGLVITVSDAEADPTTGLVAPDGRLLDVDLQQIVNGLWSAGAEAVAVSGQRVAATTAIRSANEVILVNYEPVIGPYEVLAVGNPGTLPTSFSRSPGGAWLESLTSTYGLTAAIAVRGADDALRLPASAKASLDRAEPRAPVPEPTEVP